MSIEARAWAKRLRCGSATLKAVLMAVADYANDDGIAWPSQARLASETELDKRTVRAVLKSLADLGLLRRERHEREDGSRGADRLHLNFDYMGSTPAADRDRGSGLRGGDTEPGGEGRTPPPPGPQPGRVRVVDPGGEGPRPGLVTLEPPLEQSKDRSSSIADRQPAAKAGKAKPKPGPPDSPDGFNEFYAAMPRRVGPDAARRAYDRIIRDGRATPEELLAGAKRYAVEQAGQEARFIKHPATWLNGGCWRDETSARGSVAARPEDREGAERILVRRWKASPNTWPPKLGPRPDEPGCTIAPHILAEFGCLTAGQRPTGKGFSDQAGRGCAP